MLVASRLRYLEVKKSCAQGTGCRVGGGRTAGRWTAGDECDGAQRGGG